MLILEVCVHFAEAICAQSYELIGSTLVDLCRFDIRSVGFLVRE